MLSALHVWIYFIFTSILQNGHNWRCWDPHFTHEETDAHRSCIIWSSSESKWHLQTRKLSLERYLTCLKTNGKPISKLSAMPANWHGLTMWLALVKGIFVDVIQEKGQIESGQLPQIQSTSVWIKCPFSLEGEQNSAWPGVLFPYIMFIWDGSESIYPTAQGGNQGSSRGDIRHVNNET